MISPSSFYTLHTPSRLSVRLLTLSLLHGFPFHPRLPFPAPQQTDNMSVRNGVPATSPSMKACKCGISSSNDVQHHENGIEEIKGQLVHHRRDRRSSSSAGELPLFPLPDLLLLIHTHPHAQVHSHTFTVPTCLHPHYLVSFLKLE